MFRIDKLKLRFDGPAKIRVDENIFRRLIIDVTYGWVDSGTEPRQPD